VPESNFLGREVVEIEFLENAPSINGLKAYDYFGDGSFYLLDAPGVSLYSVTLRSRIVLRVFSTASVIWLGWLELPRPRSSCLERMWLITLQCFGHLRHILFPLI
jgi:hypothetical protein